MSTSYQEQELGCGEETPRLISLTVVLTAVIQFLLWRDSRKEAFRRIYVDSSEVDSEDLVPNLSKEPDLKGATGTSRVASDLGSQV